jgi:hypothetical protein
VLCRRAGAERERERVVPTGCMQQAVGQGLPAIIFVAQAQRAATCAPPRAVIGVLRPLPAWREADRQAVAPAPKCPPPPPPTPTPARAARANSCAPPAAADPWACQQTRCGVPASCPALCAVASPPRPRHLRIAGGRKLSPGANTRPRTIRAHKRFKRHPCVRSQTPAREHGAHPAPRPASSPPHSQSVRQHVPAALHVRSGRAGAPAVRRAAEAGPWIARNAPPPHRWQLSLQVP